MSSDSVLLRRSKTSYNDGVYEPSGKDRPNPFEISMAAFSGKDGEGSQRGRNALLVFFGKKIFKHNYLD